MQATLVSLLALATLGFPQESVHLQRTYKVGEEDRYAVKLSAAVEVGDVDIQFKSRRKVKSVDQHGAAEIEFMMEELKTLINGQEPPAGAAPAPVPLVYKFDKFGMPMALEGGSRGLGSFMQFMGFLGNRTLELGKRSDFSFKDPKIDGRQATGHLKLESIKDGEAKLAAHWEILTEVSPSPLVVDMTSFVEVKSGVVLRSSGTIQPPASQGAGTRALQFSMEILRKAGA